MSRRLNRESPCEARGLLTPGPTSSFLDKLANALLIWGLVMDLSDHTDCCGSESKLFHAVACSFNSHRLVFVHSSSKLCHAWTVLLFLSMGHCILAD